MKKMQSRNFLVAFSLEHDNSKLASCGFMINMKYPFLGASPDDIVYCSCHGKYLLEVIRSSK